MYTLYEVAPSTASHVKVAAVEPVASAVTTGAAGAVGAMISILAVQNDIVPPTINHADDDLDPEIDYNLNFTFNKAQERTVRAALSNTFGFGGHNASVIFKKYQ